MTFDTQLPPVPWSKRPSRPAPRATFCTMRLMTRRDDPAEQDEDGLTTALAFGLGGRDVARELRAGRYVASSFSLGERIEVDTLQGEIIALEPAVVVVRRDDGRLVRIPNHLMLRSIVTTGAEPSLGCPPPRTRQATAGTERRGPRSSRFPVVV